MLKAGQKYCRMLQEEHSAIHSTSIKLPFVIKIFVLSIFGWQFYTGLTVLVIICIIKDTIYRFSCLSFHVYVLDKICYRIIKFVIKLQFYE